MSVVLEPAMRASGKSGKSGEFGESGEFGPTISARSAVLVALAALAIGCAATAPSAYEPTTASSYTVGVPVKVFLGRFADERRLGETQFWQHVWDKGLFDRPVAQIVRNAVSQELGDAGAVIVDDAAAADLTLDCGIAAMESTVVEGLWNSTINSIVTVRFSWNDPSLGTPLKESEQSARSSRTVSSVPSLPTEGAAVRSYGEALVNELLPRVIEQELQASLASVAEASGSTRISAASPPSIQAPRRRPEEAVALSPSEADAMLGRQRWRAVLIGIDDYSRSHGFAHDLGTPRNDVERLAQMLRAHFGFDDVSVLTGNRATRRGILQSLSRLHASASPRDNILVYYAGHGILREDGLGVWIAADSINQDDGISNSEIKDRLAALPARRVLLVSDSCFAGSFLVQRGLDVVSEDSGVEVSAEQLSAALLRNLNPSREVVTSGNLSPVSDAGIGFCQSMSPFACRLLTTLDKVPEGAAVGTTDLFVDVYRSMRQDPAYGPDQRPQRGTFAGHAGGEFVFVKR